MVWLDPRCAPNGKHSILLVYGANKYVNMLANTWRQITLRARGTEQIAPMPGGVRTAHEA